MLRKIIEAQSSDPLGDVYRKCIFNDHIDHNKLNYYKPSIEGVLKSLIKKYDRGAAIVDRKTYYRIDINGYYIDLMPWQFYNTRAPDTTAVVVRITTMSSKRLSQIMWTVDNGENLTYYVKHKLQLLYNDTGPEDDELYEAASDDPIGSIYRKCVVPGEPHQLWDREKLQYASGLIIRTIQQVANNLVKDTDDIVWASAGDKNVPTKCIVLDYFDSGCYVTIKTDYSNLFNGQNPAIALTVYDPDNKSIAPGYWYPTNDSSLTDMIKEKIKIAMKYDNGKSFLSARQITETVENDPLGAIIRKVYYSENKYQHNIAKLKYFESSFDYVLTKIVENFGYELNDVRTYSTSAVIDFSYETRRGKHGGTVMYRLHEDYIIFKYSTGFGYQSMVNITGISGNVTKGLIDCIKACVHANS